MAIELDKDIASTMTDEELEAINADASPDELLGEGQQVDGRLVLQLLKRHPGDAERGDGGGKLAVVIVIASLLGGRDLGFHRLVEGGVFGVEGVVIFGHGSCLDTAHRPRTQMVLGRGANLKRLGRASGTRRGVLGPGRSS